MTAFFLLSKSVFDELSYIITVLPYKYFQQKIHPHLLSVSAVSRIMYLPLKQPILNLLSAPVLQARSYAVLTVFKIHQAICKTRIILACLHLICALWMRSFRLLFICLSVKTVIIHLNSFCLTVLLPTIPFGKYNSTDYVISPFRLPKLPACQLFI